MGNNENLKYRRDIVCLLEYRMGNPNGDPDRLGMPRMDYASYTGYITPQCLKDGLRKAHMIQCKGDPECKDKPFIDRSETLNSKELSVLEEMGYNLQGFKKERTKNPNLKFEFMRAAAARYFDVRWFGGVFVQTLIGITGPVQTAYAESVDPIEIWEVPVTRQAITTEREVADGKTENMMGEKYIIPFGLYRCHFRVSPETAELVNFTEADYDSFLAALLQMHNALRSEAKGEVNLRKVIEFKHCCSSPLGDAYECQIGDAVKVTRKPEVQVPRHYSDYVVAVDASHLPDTIEVREII